MSVTDVLIKKINFVNGKWEGEIEFILLFNDSFYLGIAPISFTKKWTVHSVKLPLAIDGDKRWDVRKELIIASKETFSWIEKELIYPREKNALRPKIDKLRIDESRSNEETIFINFTLKDHKTEFQAILFFLNNVWHCEIDSKKTPKGNFKNFISWEDYVFDLILEELKKINKYRIKLLFNHKNYKFR